MMGEGSPPLCFFFAFPAFTLISELSLHYHLFFLPRERGIYLVIPSTPTKLNTTFAPLVVSTHSTNLAQILRDVAFHCSVWMKKKLERMQRLFHVML